MAIESSGRSFRPQPLRGFESEPSDEWREDYGRGGPVRSNEPERDWFFERNAGGEADANAEDALAESVVPRSPKGTYRDEHSYRGRGPKGYRPRDERIQELLCERLTEHPSIDPSEIAINVECGIVKVRGIVASEAMKRTLLQTIRSSLGVIGVLDEIEIGVQHPR
jgi:osmotically-inducible protein OsmY